MIDRAALQNWIDSPFSSPPMPFGPAPGDTDEIDRALDVLAEAIDRAEGHERKSMTRYLMRAPAVSRTAKILARLPSSQLMAFLERHKAQHDTMDALTLAIAASGTADRVARVNLFGRITMASRLLALKRACDAAAPEVVGAGS